MPARCQPQVVLQYSACVQNRGPPRFEDSVGEELISKEFGMRGIAATVLPIPTPQKVTSMGLEP